MTIYPKKYSEGKVFPYAKKQRGKDGKVYESAAKWVGNIKEGTVTEVRDEQGRVVREENGSPKLQTKWRNLSKTFSDIDCSAYDKGRHRGVREAEAAFKRWRSELIEKAEADYAAALAKADAAKGPGGIAVASMPIPDFMRMYLAERAEDGIEASTLEGYSYSAKIVCDYFTETSIGDLECEDLKAFDRYIRNKKKLSATTRNKACKILKQAFDAHHRQIGTDPFSDFKKSMPSPNAASPNPLDTRSLEKLKHEIEYSDPTPFICAVEIALGTEMRIGEICELRWQDVDPETGNIYVQNAIGRTKGGTVCYEKSPKRTGKNNSDPTRHIPGSPKIRAMFDRRRRFVAAQLKAMAGQSGAPEGPRRPPGYA